MGALRASHVGDECVIHCFNFANDFFYDDNLVLTFDLIVYQEVINHVRITFLCINQ